MHLDEDECRDANGPTEHSHNPKLAELDHKTFKGIQNDTLWPKSADFPSLNMRSFEEKLFLDTFLFATY